LVRKNCISSTFWHNLHFLDYSFSFILRVAAYLLLLENK
jgi:hypothetical protein